MKNIFFLIILFFLGSTAFGQSWNTITGKNSFTDSLRMLKYRHPANLDSVLTINPTTGNLMFVLRSAGGGGSGVDSITINVNNNNLCWWAGGLPTCFPLGRFFDSASLNHDSTYIKFWNSGNFIDSLWLPQDPIFAGTNMVIRDTLVTVGGVPTIGHIFDASGGGSGGSQTLQQTFNTESGGSILTKLDTINYGSFGLRILGAGVTVLNTGSINALAGSISATNSSATPIAGNSTSASGVQGSSTNSIGGSFLSTNSYAISGFNQNSTTSLGVMNLSTNPTSTNSIIPLLQMQRATSGTAANGIGASIEYQAEVSNSTSQTMGSIGMKWRDATIGTRGSDIFFNGVYNASAATYLTLSGNGVVNMPVDSVGGAYNVLWQDAAGLIHKGSASGGGGSSLFAGYGIKKLPDSTTLQADTALGKVSYSHYQGMTFYVLGNSFVSMNLLQPALENGLGVTTVSSGVGGSTISGYNSLDGTVSIVSRIGAALATNPDGIVIEGGGNDWSLSKPLGDINSTDTLTFYGAWKYILQACIAKPYAIKVIVVNMMQWGVSRANYVTQKAYVDATAQVCALYSVAYIDVFNGSGITYENMTLYSNDNVHPNTAAGQKRYGQYLVNAILSNNYVSNNIGWNTTGNGNTSLGYLANKGNFGISNVAIGDSALASNKISFFNTAVGSKALYADTSGSGLVAIGYRALTANLSGNNSIAIGQNAAQKNTSGDQLIAIGTNSLFNNTTGADVIAIGYGSALNNISGTNSIYIGRDAGNQITNSSYNVAIGHGAFTSNQTGGSNVIIGGLAGSSLTSNSNVAVGTQALGQTTSGQTLTAVGSLAMYSNLTGSNDVALGTFAGRFQADGSTAVTVADNSTFIGYHAYPLGDNQTNQTVIGYNAIGLGSNTTVLGNSSTDTTGIWGNLSLRALGKKIIIPTGTNGSAGNATLVSGTVTVSCNIITASSLISLTRKTSGGTIGTAITYTLNAGTSFTINSDNPLDTSTFTYIIIN